MPKPEFGKKVICNNCEAKFYDLNRKPAICPHCGTEYVESSSERLTTNAKQVFIDEVDTVTDDNLVGSDASESIAEVAEIEIEDEIDEDTISLEETEVDEENITGDVDIDIDTVLLRIKGFIPTVRCLSSGGPLGGGCAERHAAQESLFLFLQRL